MSISPRIKNRMLAIEAPITIPTMNSIKVFLYIHETAYNQADSEPKREYRQLNNKVIHLPILPIIVNGFEFFPMT